MVGSMFMAMVGAELLYDHLCDKVDNWFDKNNKVDDHGGDGEDDDSLNLLLFDLLYDHRVNDDASTILVTMTLTMMLKMLLIMTTKTKVREIFKQQKPAPDIERLHPAELVGTFSRYKWPPLLKRWSLVSDHHSSPQGVGFDGCFGNKHLISRNFDKSAILCISMNSIREMRNFWRHVESKVKELWVEGGVSG